MKITDIKLNEKNPRKISEERLDKLARSISSFEKMMTLRPIVVDENGVILGGNMRYKALLHLSYTEIPNNWVKVADGLTEEEKKRFVIEDNISFGEWDWLELDSEWDSAFLEDCGLFTISQSDFTEDEFLQDKEKEESSIIKIEVLDQAERDNLFEKIENMCIELGGLKCSKVWKDI